MRQLTKLLLLCCGSICPVAIMIFVLTDIKNNDLSITLLITNDLYVTLLIAMVVFWIMASTIQTPNKEDDRYYIITAEAIMEYIDTIFKVALAILWLLFFYAFKKMALSLLGLFALAFVVNKRDYLLSKCRAATIFLWACATSLFSSKKLRDECGVKTGHE